MCPTDPSTSLLCDNRVTGPLSVQVPPPQVGERKEEGTERNKKEEGGQRFWKVGCH